jgi:hypothetical protein
MAAPRVLRVVHATPGRVRLRLPWLRERPEEAEPLAEALAALDASIEVQVRPWTGSLLCTYEPEQLDEEQILAAVRRHTQVAIVLRPGEPSPQADAEYEAALLAHGSSLTRAVSEGFRDLNRGVLLATGGHLDLGALTGLGFLTLGAAEIAATRKLPAPPWFNLAWWAFRTFTIFGPTEEGGDEAGEPPAEADAGEA